jgi:flagellar biosynthesis protein
MKKPPLKAAALKYEQEKRSAPQLIAKGKGEVAEKILRLAKEHDISIFQNQALVDSLLNLNLHEEIPPRLYQGVAELFSWLMKIENRQLK